MLRLCLYLSSLLALLAVARPAHAQQPATRPFTISPAVGPTIDPQEKATYGLFPTYSADDFQEARFEQRLAPDSAVTLYLQLRDGRTVLRPYTTAELAALRQTIADRARELGGPPQAPGTPAAPTDSVGRRYRVTLRTGTTFSGQLLERRPQQLLFQTQEWGTVRVERSNVQRLEELPAGRPANWFDIGNGNRLFFQPTARNLRQGEGSLQVISLYLLGANYGITNNFSVGMLASVAPGVPLSQQVLALTPKLSAKLSENWHAGGGVLYLRLDGESAGILYANTTHGSADNNLTLGLGYLFVNGNIGRSPVMQLGGQTRVSHRVSLVSENYIVADGDAGMGGLYGAKINWRRTSLGLAGVYFLPYDGKYAFTSYIIPLYIDFTYRFGKPAR